MSPIVARPDMAAPTTAAPAPAPPAKRRFTMDLPSDLHLELKLWAAETHLDASLLVRALLEMASASVEVRTEAEAGARELYMARRAS
jgi:hypothetical protein